MLFTEIFMFLDLKTPSKFESSIKPEADVSIFDLL